MWNVEACLVLIVAALASMLRPTSAFPQHASSTVSMALRYWNMAKKRLAWAFEGSGMVAAQCQLLAAIWYIHTSEPTAAFKMLNGSLLTIDTTPPITALLLATKPATDDNKTNYATTSGTYVSVCYTDYSAK
uniref:Secreted protein n=1 Tax=Bionectria ochroleuca TaxID=29856 RepID=A0A8H7KAW8_BIOOC